MDGPDVLEEIVLKVLGVDLHVHDRKLLLVSLLKLPNVLVGNWLVSVALGRQLVAYNHDGQGEALLVLIQPFLDYLEALLVRVVVQKNDSIEDLVDFFAVNGGQRAWDLLYTELDTLDLTSRALITDLFGPRILALHLLKQRLEYLIHQRRLATLFYAEEKDAAVRRRLRRALKLR